MMPNKSKPVIDKIDRVLARYYGFADEELDFIINYDIKCRMGGGGRGGRIDACHLQILWDYHSHVLQ